MNFDEYIQMLTMTLREPESNKELFSTIMTLNTLPDWNLKDRNIFEFKLLELSTDFVLNTDPEDAEIIDESDLTEKPSSRFDEIYYLELNEIIHNTLNTFYEKKSNTFVEKVTILYVLKQLNEEGNTIVMITHDLNVAKSAGRIVHIIDGELSE